MTVKWQAHGSSDRGRLRPANEDSYLVDEPGGLFVVADGMGGHAAGALASRLAVETTAAALAGKVPIPEGMPESAGAVRAAQLALTDAVRNDSGRRGMGTTLTFCRLRANGEMEIGHIGDSRLYRLRNGTLEQLTRDHTWIQREVDAGKISPERAQRHPNAHILVRSLMADVWMDPDVLEDRALPDDMLLLCSDGLTGPLTDRQIGEVMGTGGTLEDVAAELIDRANRAGGPDNITVVLVRVTEGE